MGRKTSFWPRAKGADVGEGHMTRGEGEEGEDGALAAHALLHLLLLLLLRHSRGDGRGEQTFR